MFNMAMNDRELILKLGGPTQLAKLLGYGKHGQQRVGNWMTRGIPAAVKIDYPHIFLLDALSKAAQAQRPELAQEKEATHA